MALRIPNPDMLDIQIAVFESCEWKPGEIAERLNRSTEALRLRRTGKKRAFIEEVGAIVQEGIAKRVAIRFAAADAKRRVNEKSWRGLEAMLDRIEPNEKGEKVLVLDSLMLASFKEGLDRTEGKSLDRKAILSQHTEIHQQERLASDEMVEVDYEDLDGILAETRAINTMRKRTLLPAASIPEAELIAKPEQQTV